MRQFVFLLAFVLLSNLATAQYAQVKFINYTGEYYAGVFFTTTANGNCPTATLNTFYHDIPGDSTYRAAEVSSESGGLVLNITDVSGIALKIWPNGTSYTIPFCYAGVPISTFMAVIPEPSASNPFFTLVEWNIDASNNVIYIEIK